MKTLYMLIGYPGSGKSTISKTLFPGSLRLSSDDYIEGFAKSVNKTYNEVFDEVIKDATASIEEAIRLIKQDEYSEDMAVVWDQTNLTVKSRKAKLQKFGKDWKKVAVHVIADPLYIYHTNNKRAEFGRAIPEKILNSMMNTFERPTYDEGFDEIIMIKAERKR